jgi:hypothetical protein
LRCASEEFAAFLIQLLDGDPSKTQYRWWLGLRESHARFQISEPQRLEWLTLMGQTIADSISDPSSRDAFVEFFRSASSYIVRIEEPRIANCALAERWTAFQSLDEFVEKLGEESDEEAIEIAAGFSNRPDIHVGILAKMMGAGRAALCVHVQEALKNDPRIAAAQYNGRSLLHHAASSACVPVVQQLLDMGVDPNLLDSGGHTPLYRAAGSRSPGAASVIQALVEAGAAVDHAGGVSKSTALHEAARHGNLSAANALIKAGASPRTRDKKGLTPLDRAFNLRRKEVAAFLSHRI